MEKRDYNNWYILFVRGGYEQQIVKNIHNSLKNHQLSEQVAEIRILEGLSKTGKMKNLLSSYIFVNCIMSQKLLVAFYSTQGVISFLNHHKNDLSKNPIALSASKVNELLSFKKKINADSSLQGKKYEQTSFKNSVSKLAFEVGNLIVVKGGFLKDHRGLVVKIDPRKEMLTINIDFFGRLTPVSVKFAECEKV